METGYFVIAIISAIVWAAILHAIIAGATKSKDKMALQNAQLHILVAMAIKSGVAPEEINKILDQNLTRDDRLLKELSKSKGSDLTPTPLQRTGT